MVRGLSHEAVSRHGLRKHHSKAVLIFTAANGLPGISRVHLANELYVRSHLQSRITLLGGRGQFHRTVDGRYGVPVSFLGIALDQHTPVYGTTQLTYVDIRESDDSYDCDMATGTEIGIHIRVDVHMYTV